MTLNTKLRAFMAKKFPKVYFSVSSTSQSKGRPPLKAPVDDFVVIAERFYDTDVLALIKGIREGKILGDLSQVTIKSLDDPSQSAESAIVDQPISQAPQEQEQATSNSLPDSQAAPRGIKLSDFSLIKLLGTGASGQVFLARDLVTSEYVAVKIIQKRKLRSEGVEDALNEQAALKRIAGEKGFTSLLGSWHDTENFYFVMPYVRGGDLAIEMIGKVLEADRARLYVAELVTALECLHKHGIIHRDIKPANILINATGHLVLADLGLAHVFERANDNKRVSVCSVIGPSTSEVVVSGRRVGTPHFTAPQVYTGVEYSYEVDLWAVGVILYRMLTGRLPFMDPNGRRDFAEVAKSVTKEALTFTPKDNVDGVTRDLLHRLLAKKVTDRLTLEQIKEHAYFAGIDWEKIARREVDVPWKPYVRPFPKFARTLLQVNEGLTYTGREDPYPQFSFDGTLINVNTEDDEDHEARVVGHECPSGTHSRLDKICSFFRRALAFCAPKSSASVLPFIPDASPGSLPITVSYSQVSAPVWTKGIHVADTIPNVLQRFANWMKKSFASVESSSARGASLRPFVLKADLTN